MTVADTLSRATLLNQSESEINEGELAAYVHSISDNLPISTNK